MSSLSKYIGSENAYSRYHGSAIRRGAVVCADGALRVERGGIVYYLYFSEEEGYSLLRYNSAFNKKDLWGTEALARFDAILQSIDQL